MFIAMQTDANCYGQVFQPYPANIPTYTSTDFSICNPNWATGTTTGISPGLATISASWTGDAWFMNIGEYCDYTPVQALREALCSVLLPVSFMDASEVGSTNRSDFFGGIPATSLNINSCGGERFGIKIRFSLDSDTTVTSVDSFVSSTGMFARAPSPVDNTYVEYYGNDNPPYTITYLRKVRSDGNRTLTHKVEGTSHGRPFTRQAAVTLICQ